MKKKKTKYSALWALKEIEKELPLRPFDPIICGCSADLICIIKKIKRKLYKK